MGKVTVVGGKVGMKEPASIRPNFADNEWKTIIKACQDNTVPDTWVVGDQKEMTIGGQSCLIDIIGKNHDTYSDGGKAPLTFQLHDCYFGARIHHSDVNSGGWTSCYFRTSYVSTLLATMPFEVRSAIKMVVKKSLRGSNSTNTNNDTLFLLGLTEVMGPLNNHNEGDQYEYYAAGNSRIKKNSSGSACDWRLRTMVPVNEASYYCIYANGDRGWNPAATDMGIPYAFCF
jgi:hypothetical protein